MDVQARPISHFRSTDKSKVQFGKLLFRGGLVLTSADSAFGGWSGLTIDGDGRHFLAVSDEGTWLSGTLSYDGTAPKAITGARAGTIKALRGRALDRKRDLDAEAVTLLDGTLQRGRVLVGFERNHRIGIFPVADGMISVPQSYLPLIADMRRMRANKGFEAVAVLKGGRYSGSVIAFAERYPGPTARHTGWLWLNGRPRMLHLTDIGGFEVTDAASLDDGSLLVLERRFRWTEGVHMRIRRIAAEAIKPDAELGGETLIEADLNYEIDNMEGLAVHRGAKGEVILTLISDNNFNKLLQRNLLLQFTLTDERRAANRR